jgi:hypothetical protein
MGSGGPILRVRHSALPHGLERVRAQLHDGRFGGHLDVEPIAGAREVVDSDRRAVEQPEVVPGQRLTGIGDGTRSHPAIP